MQISNKAKSVILDLQDVKCWTGRGIISSSCWRRSNMEGSQKGGGNQFRRANIVYFLSRNGIVEHPHLTRVHHLLYNGVHLRDVKSWLAELRGKDMPNSFAWSYKRRYKSGYVWQDLIDDDLITPISDNEYVLKGSLLQFHSLKEFSLEEPTDKRGKTSSTEKPEAAEECPKPEPDTLCVGPDNDVSPKPPPQLEEGSPIKSNQRSINREQRMAVFKIDAAKEKQEEEKQRHKMSYSSRASHLFRNILKCGAADPKDSVLLPISKANGGGSHGRRTSDVPCDQHQKNSEAENSRRSQMSTRGGKNGRSRNYKPVGMPLCLQCKKPFDPEKLNSHMQSCKALHGGRSKTRLSVDKMPLVRDSRSEDDFSKE